MVKKMRVGSEKLEFTSNDRSRRAKFKNRTKSLLMKIEQLSILCGIDVGAIIFANPADADADADAHKQLLVWPPAPQHLHQLLTLYKQKAAADVNHREAEAAEPSDGDTSSTSSSHSQSQEDTNTQSLLATSSCYHHLSLQQLNELVHIVDRRIAAVDNKIRFLRKSQQGMPEEEEEVSNLSHCHRCPHAVHCCCRGCAVVDPGCSHHRGLNITLHGTCNSCMSTHSNHLI